MTSKIKIASMNVQGLGDNKKCRDVITFLKGKHLNICCIQDTHYTDKTIPFVRSLWDYECYFSNYSSQSRGVAILINNNFDFKYINSEIDDTGSYIRLDFSSQEIVITIFCIYGPNNDNPEFNNRIRGKLLTIDNACILVGDFILVIYPEKDYQNYVNINNPKARDFVLEILLEFDLVDCWREGHTKERKYTWLKKTPLKQARLDFFLSSGPLFSSLDDSKISPGYRSDYSLISITVDINKSTAGHSYCKFNNSLLKDQIYVHKIK